MFKNQFSPLSTVKSFVIFLRLLNLLQKFRRVLRVSFLVNQVGELKILDTKEKLYFLKLIGTIWVH